MLRLRYAGVLVCAALGCSPVKDSSNVPDAPIDSTDMRPPEIESSDPPNMGTKVSVLQPISVFFDEQLDESTVSATTVKLGYNQVIPVSLFVPPGGDLLQSHGAIPAGLTYVKGTVSYDAAAKKVSFVPAAPLPYGYQFVLELGVKDKGGVMFDGTFTFTTYVNAQTKQFSYSSTGYPSSWIAFTTDMAGRPAKRTGSGNPGPDTIWFTADDQKSQHIEVKFDPDGRLLDERGFNSGPDALYDTPDDPQAICIRYAYNAEKQPTERTYSNAPGPDTQWCNADDPVLVNAHYEYTDGKMTSWRYDNSPGVDGMWHTADDKCLYFWEYAYDGSGNKTREILRRCNADGLPRTADDTFDSYLDYEYDASGLQTKLVYHDDPGVDGMWLNTDDPPLYVDRWIRDGSGNITDYYRSNGPGADTIWGNADDPGQHTVNTYNAQKLVEESMLYGGTGADSMWGTADDVISRYVKTTYDALGNRIDQKTYNYGADQMWKTADDRVTSDFEFDIIH